MDAPLPLHRHREQLLALDASVAVGGVAVAAVALGRRRTRAASVLLDALAVDAEAEDGTHLAEGRADLKAKRGERRSKLISTREAQHDGCCNAFMFHRSLHSSKGRGLLWLNAGSSSLFPWISL